MKAETWEPIACKMLGIKDVGQMHAQLYNNLVEAAELVESAGGYLRSRQSIAVIILMTKQDSL